MVDKAELSSELKVEAPLVTVGKAIDELRGSE
jgi:hypothetical protein